MDRKDLELVLAIRNQASLSGAAQFLGLASSVVSKRLAGLELALGLPLFHRTTRRVSSTAEGELVCTQAISLLQSFSSLELALQESNTEPTGLIRLAATFGFGRLWLGPALAIFQTRHPQLQIQLQLTEKLPDLSREGFDGAVWLWSVPTRHASEWVSRRLAFNQRVVVASPAYLARRGMPDSPQSLVDHECLIVRENGAMGGDLFDSWSLQAENDLAPSRVQIKGALSSNSGEMVRDWCVAGRGLMLRSLWDVAPLLSSGQLLRVLPDYAMRDADIHWLAPYRAQTPKRLRLLIDFLADHLQKEPWKVN